MSTAEKNLIVQSNLSLLLSTSAVNFAIIRQHITPFVEVVKSLQFNETYQLTDLYLWSAYAQNWNDKKIIAALKKYSKYEIDDKVIKFIKINYDYYRFIQLKPYSEKYLMLSSHNAAKFAEIIKMLTTHISYLLYDEEAKAYLIPAEKRGDFKQQLLSLKLPIDDLVPYVDGKSLSIEYLEEKYPLRYYQKEAVEKFSVDKNNEHQGGAGVILMPCGSGKTIVGISVLCKLKMNTLIITSSTIALHQWKKELIEKTNIDEMQVGEYSGETKNIKPITFATYQILSYRKNKHAEFQNLKLFNNKNWGLIIYDEIHMLPSPVFRTIASIQAKRRLGLTATLVREDNKEKDVFALIGPNRYNLPWKKLEANQFIANAHCVEISLPMNTESNLYYLQNPDHRFRIAAENPDKIIPLTQLLNFFNKQKILIIGHYIKQLVAIATTLKIPLITGEMNNQERKILYAKFDKGDCNVLAVSKVANFAIDLPNAEIAIQLSGLFSSRQEEAQRLGRIIRPKPKLPHNHAFFFSIVTTNSREEWFSKKRRRFLIQQGYQYHEVQTNNLNTFLPKLVKQFSLTN